MENIMACRICLATDVKLYDMCKYRLKTAYENLTGISCLQSNINIPYVCSFCGLMLNKFTLFRERCNNSQHIMEMLLAEHSLVTTFHIKSIHNSYNLHPYSMQLIQNVDSTIKIKEEIVDVSIKPDDNIAENLNSYEDYEDTMPSIKMDDTTSNDLEIGNETESDEEPLSKKVKKKRKTNDNVDIKIENTSDECKYETVEKDIDYKLVILTVEEQKEEVLKRKESANYKNSVYKCESCYKGFMTEVTYKNHMERHDLSAGPECCSVCSTRWPDTRSLRAHILIAHERKYVCCTCSASCRSKWKAQEHARWHRGATYPCAQCGATFQRWTSYLTHARLRHPGASCHTCGERYLGARGLRLHHKLAHREKSDSAVKLVCDSCHLRFKNTDALSTHLGESDSGCDSNLRITIEEETGPPTTKKRAEWTSTQMENAVKAVQGNIFSQNEAARRFGIPRRTLRNHLRTGSVERRIGRAATFSPKQEEDLARRIIRLAEAGRPLTPLILRKQAYAFCQKHSIPNHFNDKKSSAGRRWLELFLQRHPEVNEKLKACQSPEVE